MKYALSLTLLLATFVCLAQSFMVEGTQILDPEGNEFLIKGVNVNGPHWPWSRPTVADADLITETWKFNTIRVNCFPSLAGTFPNNNVDLDAIVNTFTSREVVTIIENHDFTGLYPNAGQLEDLTDWWVDKANRFKDNTYVWFNIANEPGSGSVVPETWKTFHETVIQAIRAAGAGNIIILDGHGFGQESGYNSPDESAVQTYGPYFVTNYDNIAFSLHLYGGWIYGRERLENYIDDAHAKGLSVHIGEYGSAENYSQSVAAHMFEVVIPKEIGRIVWQWDGTDVHELTTATHGGGWEINKTNGDKPTNLSFVGNLVWEDNHGTLVPSSDDFNIPGPWLSNGNFEDDLSEWITFGNQALETTASQAQSGAKAFRINSGASGGAVQQIYLIPDTTYVLSAYGKISAAPPNGDLGVQYMVDGDQVQHVVSFSTTNYTRKEIEFRTPGSLTDASVFIYRGDGASTFHADNISLVLKNDAVTAVENSPESLRAKVYPNPAQNEVVIRLGNTPSKSIKIDLIDPLGRTTEHTAKQNDKGEWIVDTTGLKPGVYVLHINSGKEKFSRKIVIDNGKAGEH